MLISLITPAYNSARTISDTLLSVNGQTYPAIEHIIVDGLSTDGTLEVVEEIGDRREAGRTLGEGQVAAATCPVCRKVICGKDKGLYDATNKGIREATGEVVGILNSDDFFTSPDVLEEVAKAFEEDETLDAVYGDIHFVHPEDLTKCVRYYSSRVFRCWLMRLGFMPAHPSFYVRRSCYQRLGLYKTDYRICADFELLLRYLFVHRIRARYLPMDFVTMRTGGISTSGLSACLQIMKEHLRAFRENHIYTNRLILSLRYAYKVLEFVRR